MPHWIEDITQKGEKYRREFVTGDSKEGAAGDARFFNGRHSWVNIPRAKWVEQASGNYKVAKILQDYYGDMIGLSRLSRAGLPRSLAGDTGLPYELDRLIPSGAYHLAGRQPMDGEDCVILERPGLDRLWLSERYEYAIVRREWNWSVGGPLKRVIRNTDFREVAPHHWLPWKCVMDIYGTPLTNPARLVGTLEATLQEANVAVSDDLFEPNFPPRTRVYDLDSGTDVTLGKSDEGSLERLIAEAREHRGAIRRPPTRWPYFLIAGAGIIAVAVVVIRRFRGRALLLVLFLSPVPPVLADGGDGSTAYWRDQKRCGLNCLYGYLKLHDKTISLKAIDEAVPVGDEGANMADLRRVAIRLGLPSRVVRAGSSDLAGFTLPVIAHLRGRGGHFVLLLGANTNVVSVSDMTNGRINDMSHDSFLAVWSGYLLVPDDGIPLRFWVLGSGAVLALAVCLLNWRRGWQ